jgi:hypothetical protein
MNEVEKRKANEKLFEELSKMDISEQMIKWTEKKSGFVDYYMFTYLTNIRLKANGVWFDCSNIEFKIENNKIVITETNKNNTDFNPSTSSYDIEVVYIPEDLKRQLVLFKLEHGDYYGI